MDDYEFIARYDIAETFRQKIKCIIAKLFGTHVVTPLGRIMLLPKDYRALAEEYDVSIPW